MENESRLDRGRPEIRGALQRAGEGRVSGDFRGFRGDSLPAPGSRCQYHSGRLWRVRIRKKQRETPCQGATSARERRRDAESSHIPQGPVHGAVARGHPEGESLRKFRDRPIVTRSVRASHTDPCDSGSASTCPKAASSTLGSIIWNTTKNVSCDGMACLILRKSLKMLSFARPKAVISAQDVAPQRTETNAITRSSPRSCRAFSARGSGKLSKAERKICKVVTSSVG